MSAAMAGTTPGHELARNMSLFAIDEALMALVESAQDEAAANGGELSEHLRTALADYVEAFGEKVDRIASYLKAQESFAELAKREEERLHARRKSAENRVKGLKSFLSFLAVVAWIQTGQGTSEHNHAFEEQRGYANCRRERSDSGSVSPGHCADALG